MVLFAAQVFHLSPSVWLWFAIQSRFCTVQVVVCDSYAVFHHATSWLQVCFYLYIFPYHINIYIIFGPEDNGPNGYVFVWRARRRVQRNAQTRAKLLYIVSYHWTANTKDSDFVREQCSVSARSEKYNKILCLCVFFFCRWRLKCLSTILIVFVYTLGFEWYSGKWLNGWLISAMACWVLGLPSSFPLDFRIIRGFLAHIWRSIYTKNSFPRTMCLSNVSNTACCEPSIEHMIGMWMNLKRKRFLDRQTEWLFCLSSLTTS